jgi:hypothetical protein
METLVCDKNQGDYDGGDLSCTAASLLWGRYCLEKTPTKKDMHKILEAGGRIWNTWHRTSENGNALPCWTEVVKTYPGIFENIEVVYETNGVFSSQNDVDEELKEWLLVGIKEAIDHVTEKGPRSAVITVGSSSYAFSNDTKHLFFFDSHGSGEQTNGNAYMLRFATKDDLHTFIANNFTIHSEFTLVVFQKVQGEDTVAERT